MSRAAFGHLVNKHSRLIAPHHGQLAEQRRALEGDAEDAAAHANRFGTGAHKEGRGRGPRQAGEDKEQELSKRLDRRT